MNPLDSNTENNRNDTPQSGVTSGIVLAPSRKREEYTVGWICALPIELAAAKAMLDERHRPLPQMANDSNAYEYGSMYGHNIVMACLPSGEYGTTSATAVAKDMLRSFSIRVGLMVGIGGGVPKHGVHLGDVVISKPSGEFGGVVQYDFGKAMNEGKFIRTGSLNSPPKALLTALATLQSDVEMYGDQSYGHIDELAKRYPVMKKTYASPESLKDVLFRAGDQHDGSGSCEVCLSRFTPLRQGRGARLREVHYGLIASGNQVMKDAKRRDNISDEMGESVLCFEMEAAGLMSDFPCLVIRGICDYSDSHKHKAWQRYAAAIAAAEAKEILRFLSPRETSKVPVVDQSLDLDSLAKWLVPRHDWSATHVLIRNKRIHDQAGQWVFEDTQFREWRKRPGNRLWLHGKVGTGKTVLCSSIIEYLKAPESDSSSDAYPVMFFYFAFNKSDDQTLESFLISILYQFCASQGIPEPLRLLFLKYSKLKKMSHGNSTVPRPIKSEILKVFLNISQSLPNGGFLVMDALDEITHGLQREDFLHFLRRVTSNKGSKLNILVTSQSEPDFTNQFRWDLGWKILGLGRTRVDEDIALFVQDELSTAAKFSRLSVSDRKRIETYLVQNANGVFQWVDLILQTLLGPMVLRKIQIEEILQSLPRDLKQTYDRLLQRVEESDAPEIALALKWLSLAKRPLYIEEVIEASILDSNNDTTLNTERRLNAMQLLSCLTGLVTLEPELSRESTIRTETHVLALAHSSIRGYLILKDHHSAPSNYYQFNKHLADEFIAQCCVEYLTHCYLASWRRDIYPLATYSNRFWEQHAKHNPELLSHLREKINSKLLPLLYPKDGVPAKLLDYNPADNSFANNSEDLAHPLLETLKATDRLEKPYLVFKPLLDPVSGFRLLILLPSPQLENSVECRLQHVSMDDPPFYRALSYVWGDGPREKIIFVDGAIFHVSYNLEKGLRQLRQAGGASLQAFWIDAICINQADVEEKTHQVALMSSIFQSAHKVIVWLSEDFASSKLAMQALSKFQDIPDSIQSVANGLMSISADTWYALQDLFRNGWFRRVWIVPEVVVAKDVEVLCGQQSFPWSVFERIEKAYAAYGRELHEYTFDLRQALTDDTAEFTGRAEFCQYILGSKALTAIVAIRRRYHIGVPFKLPELVVLMSDRNCLVPQDRVSVLHMMRKAYPGQVLPLGNYNPSPNEFYQMFTEYCLENSRELNLLSYVDTSLKFKEPLSPSWVPDWGAPLLQSLDQGHLAQPFKESCTWLYNATLGSIASPQINASKEAGTLNLSGIYVGTVETVGKPKSFRQTRTFNHTPDSAVSGVMRRIVTSLSKESSITRLFAHQWRELMDNHNVLRCYGRGALDETFWRTVLADQEFTPFGETKRLRRQWSWYKNIEQLLSDWEKAGPSYLENRTFFRSEEGWVGLCPRNTHPGDRIVLLHGGRLPFIVRLNIDNGGHNLIGEAYVHGIMDGELLKSSELRGEESIIVGLI